MNRKEEIEYKEIRELIDEIINKCRYKKPIFRGISKIQESDREISSPLFRKFNKNKEVKGKSLTLLYAERDIIENARIYFPSNTSDVEILTELRHYGADVNLIDFSRSLYVSLFFICNKNYKEDGQLIILETDGLKIRKEIKYPENSLELKFKKSNKEDSVEQEVNSKYKNNPQIIEPTQIFSSKNRVISQSSIFVYCYKGYLDKKSCIKEIIKKEYKKDILDYIEKYHNISLKTIYNDVIGFIKSNNDNGNYILAHNHYTHGEYLYKKFNREGDKVKDEVKSINEIINQYDEAINLNPYYVEAYASRSLMKFIIIQDKGALEDINRSIELDSNNSIHYLQRGYIRLKNKDFENAMIDVEKSIQLDPSNNLSYCLRGEIRLEQKLYEKAIDDFNTSIEFQEPVNYIAHYSRGRAYYYLRHFEKARDDFKKALTLNPPKEGREMCEKYISCINKL